MSITILRPHPMVCPVEAMRLRDNFDMVAASGGTGVIVDLTGVQELCGAGLAAVTSIVTRGRQLGIEIRVLLPDESSGAARIIDQADLRRFLRPGGRWNESPVREPHKPAATTRMGVFAAVGALATLLMTSAATGSSGR